jgi:hypothetical protein
MRLFRSGEHVAAVHREPGAVFPVAQLWRLAVAWYGDRLSPDWRPRTVRENQRVLDDVGLTGPFWQLQDRR